MDHKILALDLACSTGWAMGRYDGTCSESGVHRLQSKGWKRLAEHRRFVEGLAKQCGFIYYERPHLRGYRSTRLLVGLANGVEEIADRLEIPVREVHSGTLKKWATGSGKAKKPEMIRAASQVYPGLTILNDDHADALLLLRYAVNNYGLN